MSAPLPPPPSFEFGKAEAVGLLSAGACGAILLRATGCAKHGVCSIAIGGVGLAACAFGLWVRRQVYSDPRGKVVQVLNRQGQIVGNMDEEGFLELCKCKRVTLLNVTDDSLGISGAHPREHDQSGVLTQALFCECDDATKLYDTQLHPFFQEAQKATNIRSYVVPIGMFYRIGARLTHAEASPFLVIPTIGRSGSTLLANLIDLHPQIVTISEPMDVLATQLLASQSHASGLRYTYDGALLAAAAALSTLVIASAHTTSSRSVLVPLAASTCVWTIGLHVSSAVARWSAPQLLQMCFRFWLKDVASGQVACVKLSQMSSIMLRNHGQVCILTQQRRRCPPVLPFRPPASAAAAPSARLVCCCSTSAVHPPNAQTFYTCNAQTFYT